MRLFVAALVIPLAAGAQSPDNVPGICVDRETDQPCSGSSPPAAGPSYGGGPASQGPSREELISEGERRWAERKRGLRAGWDRALAPLAELEERLAQPIDPASARFLIDRNSPAFGLGGSRGVTNIPAVPRVAEPRDLDTAAKRLACAFGFSEQTFAFLARSGPASAEAIEEIAHSAEDTLGALAGQPLGMPCREARTASRPADPAPRAERLQTLFEGVLRKVEDVRTVEGTLAAVTDRELRLGIPGEVVLPRDDAELKRLRAEAERERDLLLATLRKDAEAERILREAGAELEEQAGRKSR